MSKNYKKIVITSTVDRMLVVSVVKVSQPGSQGVTCCGTTGWEIFTVPTKTKHTHYKHKDYSTQIRFSTVLI